MYCTTNYIFPIEWKDVQSGVIWLKLTSLYLLRYHDQQSADAIYSGNLIANNVDSSIEYAECNGAPLNDWCGYTLYCLTQTLWLAKIYK